MNRAHCALRLGVRDDDLDLVERDLVAGDQGVADRLVVLAGDRDLRRVEGEGVESGPHRALDRVLEGNERPVRAPVRDGAIASWTVAEATASTAVSPAARRSASSV